MSSSFGTLWRVTTFGESHGGGVGVVVDGCPPRLAVDVTEVQAELDRRRPGQSRLTTQRREADRVRILSGVFEGRTTGSPVTMVVDNTDARPGAYEHLAELYRPSHADWTYEAKYGFRAWAGGGRASARETVGRVAAGALARQLLAAGIGDELEVIAWVSSVHDVDADVDAAAVTRDLVEASPTRCPDPDAARSIVAAIDAARRDGDSVGGVVTCVGRGVPAGLGDPVFDKLDARLAAGMMSLPAVKGVEIGSGFAGTRLRGSEHNDPFVAGSDGTPVTTSNRSGGVQGGISNGAEIVVRVAFKPTATINATQRTVTRGGDEVDLEATGRHDPCVVPRAVPLVEAMALCVLADAWLCQRSVDVLPRTDRDR